VEAGAARGSLGGEGEQGNCPVTIAISILLFVQEEGGYGDQPRGPEYLVGVSKRRKKIKIQDFTRERGKEKEE